MLLAQRPVCLWLILLLQRPQTMLGIGWIPRPVIADLPATLWNLLSGFGGGSNTMANMLFGLVALLLVGLGVWRDDSRHLARRALIFGIVFPLGGIWLISQHRPVYVDRYFIILLPFVVVMLARGAQVLVCRVQAARPRWWQWRFVPIGIGLGAVALGLWAGGQVLYAGTYAREDWRGLAQLLTEQAGTNPMVWLPDPGTLVPLRYYYKIEFQPIDQAHSAACLSDSVLVRAAPAFHGDTCLQPEHRRSTVGAELAAGLHCYLALVKPDGPQSLAAGMFLRQTLCMER
jgi:hypothetical protein